MLRRVLPLLAFLLALLSPASAYTYTAVYLDSGCLSPPEGYAVLVRGPINVTGPADVWALESYYVTSTGRIVSEERTYASVTIEVQSWRLVGSNVTVVEEGGALLVIPSGLIPSGPITVCKMSATTAVAEGEGEAGFWDLVSGSLSTFKDVLVKSASAIARLPDFIGPFFTTLEGGAQSFADLLGDWGNVSCLAPLMLPNGTVTYSCEDIPTGFLGAVHVGLSALSAAKPIATFFVKNFVTVHIILIFGTLVLALYSAQQKRDVEPIYKWAERWKAYFSWYFNALSFIFNMVLNVIRTIASLINAILPF
jgi:hypothetical protein